jgi:uncharacterized membrane protein YdbT with pleckstrin-like domain
MSYVAKNLLQGENVAFTTKLHWKLFVIPALIVVLVLLPLTYWALQSNTKPMVMLPLALILIALFPPYLQRLSSEFAVTNKRVIMKVGVLTTRSYELLLSKVEGISVDQPLFGKLFGYGSIVVTGSGGTQEPFANIQSPLEFRRAVQSVTDLQLPLART